MDNLNWGRVTIVAGLACSVCVSMGFVIRAMMPGPPAVRGPQDNTAIASGKEPQVTADSVRTEASGRTPVQWANSAVPAQNGDPNSETSTPSPVQRSTVAITANTAYRDKAGGRPGKSGRLNVPQEVQGERGLVILQLGDSHTSADFLTGELRRRLQQRYGNGGTGYATAGRPHIGVRNSAIKVAVSPGWTYRSIQKSDNISEFWLSGFNAVATVPGEVLTFTLGSPVEFDSIEIEGLRQPGGGSIDISIDGAAQSSYDLNASSAEPIVLRLTPDGAPTDRARQIEIRTHNPGPVSIASVAVYNKQSGVSYSSIGYPGATVDLLNKFDQTLMADDLRRLNPQIVVLSFGTNEASKKNLDLVAYEQNYEKVIDKIKTALPAAEFVLIGPPDGAERAPHCTGKPSTDAVCRPSAPERTAESGECDWHTLPKLEGVRNVERKIAERRGFAFWNWASIMPPACGAHQWATLSPPLMASDHIHFTISGYNKSAEQFLNTLIPVIEKLRVRPNIASN
jgi:lysophospholipase L1-like esterase